MGRDCSRILRAAVVTSVLAVGMTYSFAEVTQAPVFARHGQHTQHWLRIPSDTRWLAEQTSSVAQ